MRKKPTIRLTRTAVNQIEVHLTPPYLRYTRLRRTEEAAKCKPDKLPPPDLHAERLLR